MSDGLIRRTSTVDEVDAGEDVAPLVGPTELECTVARGVEVIEVVGLEELVRELSEGYSSLRRQTRLHARPTISGTGRHREHVD